MSDLSFIGGNQSRSVWEKKRVKDLVSAHSSSSIRLIRYGRACVRARWSLRQRICILYAVISCSRAASVFLKIVNIIIYSVYGARFETYPEIEDIFELFTIDKFWKYNRNSNNNRLRFYCSLFHDTWIFLPPSLSARSRFGVRTIRNGHYYNVFIRLPV